MKALAGTKTEKNLQEAFAGESQARNKYSYWASKAKKDGYVQIAAIFEETANNEKEHAKMWFKLLEGGKIKDTTENAEKFRGVAAIEKHHEARYRKLLDNIEQKKVFSRDGDAIWQCRNCGHIVIGKQAPEVCPVCDHPQAYFELQANNF